MTALPSSNSPDPARSLSELVSFHVPSLLESIAKFIVPKKPPIANDVRFTPQKLFSSLNDEFGFTLDVAACASSTKCGRFFSAEDDGLSQSWAGENVWCNHPWSQTPAWVAKNWLEALRGCPVSVMLLPDNRAHQGFWQELVEGYRDRPLGAVSLSTRHLKGRPHFGTQTDPLARRKNRAKNGCTLLIFRSAVRVRHNTSQLALPFPQEAA